MQHADLDALSNPVVGLAVDFRDDFEHLVAEQLVFKRRTIQHHLIGIEQGNQVGENQPRTGEQVQINLPDNAIRMQQRAFPDVVNRDIVHIAFGLLEQDRRFFGRVYRFDLADDGIVGEYRLQAALLAATAGFSTV